VGQFRRTAVPARCITSALFVRGLTTVLLSGGLGVKDQHNDLREFPVLPHVIYFFVGLKKLEVFRPAPRTLDELNNKFETLATVLLLL
jgi:hypothetical protein